MPSTPEPWLVYMLRCRDASLYTGITNNLTRRLAAHAAGRASRYTRSRRPVRLAYQESLATRSLALKREAAIKRMSRRAKLALVTAGDGVPKSAARPAVSATVGGGLPRAKCL